MIYFCWSGYGVRHSRDHKHKILTEQVWLINELFVFLCRTVNSNRPLSTQEGNNITVKAKPFEREGGHLVLDYHPNQMEKQYSKFIHATWSWISSILFDYDSTLVKLLNFQSLLANLVSV